MSCCRPMVAFRTGLKTETGKDQIVLMSDRAHVCTVSYAEKRLRQRIPFDPAYQKVVNGTSFLTQEIMIPCGQCIGCRLDKSREWALRCCLEASRFEHNQFITLTYDEGHLPPDGKLRKRDFQLFLKRLRKAFGNGLRYFACGEYGSRTLRPHYHAIMFNLDLEDLYLWSQDKGNRLYRSPSLEKIWGLGNVLIGDCSFSSCAYVARYTAKKVEVDDAHRPFLLMSRRPGIGMDFLNEHVFDIYSTDKVYFNIDGRVISKPPHYFDYLLEKEYPELLAAWKDIRKGVAEGMQNARRAAYTFSNKEDFEDYQTKILSDKVSRLYRNGF